MKNKIVRLQVIEKGLTYQQAKNELLKRGVFITRPNFRGYHFRYFEHYGIRLPNGNILFDPEKIYNTDKNDWMIVEIKDNSEIEKVYKEIVRVLESE